MKYDKEALFEQLQNVLKNTYDKWKVAHLGILGAGLDTLICCADSAEFGAIAIKVPWQRWISNKNDTCVDARKLLYQEATLATHLHVFGVPTPKIYAFHEGDDDFDFLVSELIEQDHSTPGWQAVGALVRAIHECPMPSLSLVMEERGVPVHELLAKRLFRRLQILAQLSGESFPLTSSIHDLAAMFYWPEARCSILHMDIRPENLLTRNGTVVSIIDWSNALFADPSLDLARTAEYGYLSEDFLTGYGNMHCFARVPRVVELLYRLDTATMLAVVFFSSAPDAQRGKQQVQRVAELCAALQEETR